MNYQKNLMKKSRNESNAIERLKISRTKRKEKTKKYAENALIKRNLKVILIFFGLMVFY